MIESVNNVEPDICVMLSSVPGVCNILGLRQSVTPRSLTCALIQRLRLLRWLIRHLPAGQVRHQLVREVRRVEKLEVFLGELTPRLLQSLQHFGSLRPSLWLLRYETPDITGVVTTLQGPCMQAMQHTEATLAAPFPFPELFSPDGCSS